MIKEGSLHQEIYKILPSVFASLDQKIPLGVNRQWNRVKFSVEAEKFKDLVVIKSEFDHFVKIFFIST